MAGWTALVWRQAARALLLAEQCDIPHSTIGLNCSLDWVTSMMGTNRHYAAPAPRPGTAPALTSSPAPGGVRVSVAAPPPGPAPEQDPSDLDPLAILTTDQAYSQMGRSLLLTDMDGDGETDLLVSAPGLQGCVHILYSYRTRLPVLASLPSLADTTLCGEEGGGGRFGAALAVLDLNSDGVADLAVGAPYTGAKSLQYQGLVRVYWGVSSPGNYSLRPGPALSCVETPCGLGAALAAGPGGGLVVGAPWTGRGGRQRGAVVRLEPGLDWEDREYTVPGDLDWTLSGRSGPNISKCNI